MPCSHDFVCVFFCSFLDVWSDLPYKGWSKSNVTNLRYSHCVITAEIWLSPMTITVEKWILQSNIFLVYGKNLGKVSNTRFLEPPGKPACDKCGSKLINIELPSSPKPWPWHSNLSCSAWRMVSREFCLVCYYATPLVSTLLVAMPTRRNCLLYKSLN